MGKDDYEKTYSSNYWFVRGQGHRLVYPVENPPNDNLVIEIDHKITPSVKLLKFIPPSTAEIQRPNGQVETINFEEAWDPSVVKPIMTV